jgi:hypothetical protein
MPIVILTGCLGSGSLFEKRSSKETGIRFSNNVTENDSINPLDFEFLYNGGGVAAADLNNDGLTDLYFTASMVPNKCYLNRGNFHFEDITDLAGISGDGAWSNGVSVADINGDGRLDIYVATSVKKDPAKRRNLLYINQGNNAEGVPLFTELAAEYGLSDTGYSVQSAFFDYDHDGDLDMYLVNTRMSKRNAVVFSVNQTAEDSTDFDRFYRNDWNDSLQHPYFTDVTGTAGISGHGFGLGVTVSDINQDGWQDIYVTNDFFSDDVLYVNRGNGTFANATAAMLKHTSKNAMGNDIADLNNDGRPDIFAVDMNPEDNFRKKKNMNSNGYFVHQKMATGSPYWQYVRNTLQLNMGPSLAGGDSLGLPVFAEVGFLSGMAETDWSWNVSLADFDNSGLRDVVITNGYPKDVTDHDFGNYRNRMVGKESKKQIIEQIPSIKISNYAFRNNGQMPFEDVTNEWGMNEPGFSNGAVYADLDNDGDLDYVINNINSEASVYENKLYNNNIHDSSFLKIRFVGSGMNRNGLGASVEIFYDKGKRQFGENAPVRGYLSCTEPDIYFGLGKIRDIDSVVLRWPGFRKQVLYNVKSGNTIVANIREALIEKGREPSLVDTLSLFRGITRQSNIDFIHQEMDYADFDIERLLPHKFSQQGPALAVADIDGNGTDDLFVAGSGDFPGTLFSQLPSGKFESKKLQSDVSKLQRRPEVTGSLFFDADGDDDMDLYCVSGSNESPAGSPNYQDVIWVNDGNGHFKPDNECIPQNRTSKSCIKAADFDRDGDQDLFIGGKILPGRYPTPVSSFVYRNDSRPGQISFTDVSKSIIPGLENLGLVNDAIWTDFNNDDLIDLIIVGEWMNITFFQQTSKGFIDVSSKTGIDAEKGWWNSIAGGDFDNDGDIDYIVGNLGLNSYFRASHQYPLRVYANDFDGNGTSEPVISGYFKSQQGVLKEYPSFFRDDLVSQIPGLRKRFPTYSSFGEATIQELLSHGKIESSLKLYANNFSSVILINKGSGKFDIRPLPIVAQFAPVYGMVVDDYNRDGWLDAAICGNEFGNEVTNGKLDALNGLILLGDGYGGFREMSIAESGIFVPGDARSMVLLRGPNQAYQIAVSQHKGPLELFAQRRKGGEIINPQKNDMYALIYFDNGTLRKQEIYKGTSYLSQSGQYFQKFPGIKMIEVINSHGKKIAY